jgi:Flp pilus assembly protein TadG
MRMMFLNKHGSEPTTRTHTTHGEPVTSRANTPLLRGLKRRPQLHSEEGATLVEFAFASWLFVMLLFLIIATSIAAYSYNFVSEAARDGARYAIVRGASCVYMPDCAATEAQIQTHIRSLNYPGIKSSNLTATVAWYKAGAAPPNMTWTTNSTCSTAPAPTSCKAIGNAVKVTVNYPYKLSMPFHSPVTINMSNSSMMVISQ